MIAKQFSLINFSEQTALFREFCALLHDHVLDLYITKDNIIHVPRECCEQCGKVLAYNGSYESSALYYRSQFVCFKVGQQYCYPCNRTYLPRYKPLKVVVERTNQFLEQQMVSLAEKGLSYPDISEHLQETLSVRVSPEHVSNLVENYVSCIDLADPLIYPDGWYLYDEQHLKVSGKKFYRVTIYHAKSLTVVYERDHKVFNKAVLMDILETVFEHKKPRGFTFDMAPSYPGVFTEVFGKGIGMQWCLFHLNQAIFKEVRAHLRIVRKVYWTLEDIHQMYEFLACHYIRDTTIDYIINCKKRLEQFKEFIKGKTQVKNPEKAIRDFEKQLVREVFRYQHQLKLMRKRNKETLTLRTKEDALKHVKDLLYRKMTFMKPLQKRIEYIHKHFDRFTTHLDHVDAEHTNNKLEGRFGVTLRKTEKVKFRSRFALQMCLKLKKLKSQGALFFETFPMGALALIGMFGLICGIPR